MELTDTDYAPVVIPTLCRYNHLRECLESLMKCKGANKTDIYIGLDYPSKAEHKDGWYKIDRWLKDLESNNIFKSLTVIRHHRNVGLGDSGNLPLMIRYVLKNYDKVIVTEDDNVFSPAFLDYINKGLKIFENDKSVFSINGYRHPYDVICGNSNFFRQNVDFSAWGFGIWKDRWNQAEKFSKRIYWLSKLVNPINYYRVKKNGLNRLLSFVRIIRHPRFFEDNVFSILMAVNNQDVVMPEESMVRNMGWDGSGANCGIDTMDFCKKPLFRGESFEYKGSGIDNYEENRMIHVADSYKRMSWSSFFKELLHINRFKK